MATTYPTLACIRLCTRSRRRKTEAMKSRQGPTYRIKRLMNASLPALKQASATSTAPMIVQLRFDVRYKINTRK